MLLFLKGEMSYCATLDLLKAKGTTYCATMLGSMGALLTISVS